MTGLLEFNARAELCRQLAEIEQDSRNLWLAEAERWSRQKPGVADEALEPDRTHCWEIMPKFKHRVVNAAEVQFGLPDVAKPAVRDTFEEFLIRTLQ